MIDDNNLPGADLVAQGRTDLRANRTTVEALLVAVGAPRLLALGVSIPQESPLPLRPEHGLYDLLARTDPQNAHTNYNALVRRLVSHEHARELLLSH